MASYRHYNLVHMTAGGEYKTPLVASQLFDQAECQAVEREGAAPGKVEAWIIGSMREYWDKASRKKVAELERNRNHIRVRMMNGISRLEAFPVLFLLKYYRRKLGLKVPVVYHCRGVRPMSWAILLRSAFPGDRIILDVRGYWPAEIIYRNGVEDPELATGNDKTEHDKAFDHLKLMIAEADAVTAVSESLKELLVTKLNAPADTSIVPCCVNKITEDTNRAGIRAEWGLSDEDIAVVYSGTTAAYQHLEDLTIPFMKQLLLQDASVKLVFLTPQAGQIGRIITANNIPENRVIIRSLPQFEVADALTACDAGILIRKPTLVNRVANPVKIAEYMAAGLPIIVEKGVGGVSRDVFNAGLMKEIEIADNNVNALGNEAIRVIEWLKTGQDKRRGAVRDYVKREYLWSSAIKISRKMYQKVLAV